MLIVVGTEDVRSSSTDNQNCEESSRKETKKVAMLTTPVPYADDSDLDIALHRVQRYYNTLNRFEVVSHPSEPFFVKYSPRLV